MLTEWKNLNTIQDTRKVSSIEEFKNKKFRYQMSEYSVEIERLVLRLENLLIEGASLDEMVQVPLAVIAGWARIECPQNKIYIVENPSVYAMLCSDECGTADDGGMDNLGDMTAYMCMNGQPRLAGLMVLELLARSGTTVYYAGDIDPEGLLIAQKLSRFYDGKFNFWHMDAEDYIVSRSSEKISYRRLKTLEKITDERLMPAARMIMKYKTAGYQERIVYK